MGSERWVEIYSEDTEKKVNRQQENENKQILHGEKEEPRTEQHHVSPDCADIQEVTSEGGPEHDEREGAMTQEERLLSVGQKRQRGLGGVCVCVWV